MDVSMRVSLKCSYISKEIADDKNARRVSAHFDD